MDLYINAILEDINKTEEIEARRYNNRSLCDNDDCSNRVMTIYYDESNHILETYPCEDCIEEGK